MPYSAARNHRGGQMDQTTASSDTKPCLTCAEPIKKQATICIHCNTYQDWRRRLTFSGTILSLLVALFGVLTVALPAISDFITPKNSHIFARYQGTHGNVITALVTNSGIRAGTIHDAKLYITLSKTTTEILLNIEGASDGGALLIEPATTLLVNFAATTSPTAAVAMLKAELRTANYELLPAVTNFDGSSGTAPTDVPKINAMGLVGPLLPQ
jgi:hypothetical protein